MMHPQHIWHIDLSVAPTTAGFWVPWLPCSKPLCWPFCWRMAVAIDHFSRRANGFALFTKAPSSVEICEFLDRVAARVSSRPKHVITDHGRQFISETFRGWCRRRGIRSRFGAVGKTGSIAIIERFFRSMKAECAERILVPLGFQAMRDDLASYTTWYNVHRPHQALDGLTPAEVHDGETANTVSFEPRPRWPANHDEERERVRKLRLVVNFMEGRRHLPIVALKRAA